ncbi:1366_t:CDS:2, partial [Racocetra fulgida]
EVSDELFIVADKFHENTSNSLQDNRLLNYLNTIINENQKLIYETLHSVYKVALQIALLNKSRLHHLIKILQEFADENNESSNNEFSQNDFSSNKESVDSYLPHLQNSKRRHGKGRPLDI